MNERASAKADVYKAGVLAATLARTHAGVMFEYRSEYLVTGLPPVASSLPLRDDPIALPGGAVPPFFAGLLPEGRRLTALRRAIKTSADDELSLLIAVGSDTIGDVQVMPAGEPPIPAPALLQIPANLADFSFQEALERAEIIDRVGLPGVQEKVSGRMINVPASQTGTSVIVKLAPPEFPFVIENEAFFLGLAKAAGLKTVSWHVLEDGRGVKALAVERFDRAGRGHAVTRLAFEDAAQVLEIWPADKYNVSLEEAARALLALTAAPIVAARDLFGQVVFAVLTGNGDQHAKNLALLATDRGEWRIGPAFDIPSTVAYGDVTLALPIQGSSQPFSRRKLLAFAGDIGLPQPAAERVLDHLLDRTQGPLSELDPVLLPFSSKILAKLEKTFAYRRRQLSA